MKNWIKIISTIVIVLVIDLITKHFLFNVTYFNLIPNVVSIATNYGNDGAAWGIMSGEILTLVIISCVMLVALFIYNHFVKNKNTFYCLGFGLMVGGALGNLIDRLWLNYVRDFIFLDFWPTFPTFNIADSCLCVGTAMLAIFIIFCSTKKEK